MRILPVLLAAGGLLATAGAQEPPPKPRTPTGDYVRHSLRYWLDRTSYYRLPNPLNLLNVHPNDGIDERLKAIEALGHYGSNGVPKLTLIVAEPKRTVAESGVPLTRSRKLAPPPAPLARSCSPSPPTPL